MRILHVTTAVEGASGVATFVRELDASLRARGVESRVWRSCELGVKSCELGGGRRPELVHIHGLWLKPYHLAAKWARANGVPIVWSTHGMTAPWSMRHKRWKKLPAWWLYQKRDLKSAAAIHCTTDQEVEWNKALGFNNCFIAPLGTREFSDHVEQVEHAEKRLLFVGRIYPVKGLVNLIRAWSLVVSAKGLGVGGQELGVSHRRRGEWKLRIVGPDEAGHQAELEKLVDDLDLRGSVEFSGPKFGEELSREYDNCDCLILPSFTENFGATVVDAMAHGKPCIASTFTPWCELRDRGCGWWVSNDPEQLAGAIGEMMSLDDATRREMGERGRRLVEEKYTWGAVAETMQNEYAKLGMGVRDVGR